MSSLPRPLKRLTGLALLVAGLTLWRNRMISAHERQHPSPARPGPK